MFWRKKKVYCDKCKQEMIFLEKRMRFSRFLNREVKMALYRCNCGETKEVADE